MSRSADRQARRAAAHSRIQRHNEQTLELLTAQGIASEDAALIAGAPLHAWAQTSLVRPIGVVTSREARVSPRWRGSLGDRLPSRTVGTFCHPTDGGFDPVLTDDGTATVLVVRDGEGAILPASTFRRTRQERTARTSPAATEHRTTAADLPPVFAD